MKEITLNVTGMSCGHCVSSVERALKEIGVDSKVNLADGTVTVAFDENKVTLATMKEAIEEQGYDVT